MDKTDKIPPGVARKLKHYVYLYIHPETGEVFYVGKGKANRVLAHANGDGKAAHNAIIRDLEKRGLKPRVELLIHGLKSDNEALAVEMAAIDLLGLEKLSNSVKGHHSSRRGRMPVEQVVTLYQKKPVHVVEPAILIRINRLYRYGMSEAELYEATRGVWKVGKRREEADYAFAVFRGIVKEVYKITQWFPAGQTFRSNHPEGNTRQGRWEFIGTRAPAEVRDKYLNRDVSGCFAEYSQNPITYVNC